MGIMNVLQGQVTNNVGISLEATIIIIFLLGGFIFYAKSFQIGIIIQFVGSGALFMMFYALGLNYTYPIVIFFMSLVVLSLSLLASGKTAQTGGLI